MWLIVFFDDEDQILKSVGLYSNRIAASKASEAFIEEWNKGDHATDLYPQIIEVSSEYTWMEFMKKDHEESQIV